MRLLFLRVLWVVLSIPLLSPIASAVAGDIPPPPEGGTGSVPVLIPIYNAKKEQVGVISLVYIFEKGKLKGVRKRKIEVKGERKSANGTSSRP